MFEIDKAEWEIVEENESIDTNCYGGTCQAEVNGVIYWANCDIYREHHEVSGSITDIESSSIEIKPNQEW
jgi:hypothetical protein